MERWGWGGDSGDAVLQEVVFRWRRERIMVGPMGNAAWVCFKCRESVRRPTHYTADVPCPKCGQRCRCIGTKIPVPAKRDVRAWRELRAGLDAQAVKVAEAEHRERVRRRHSLEQEIRRLESRPKNDGRGKAIGLLKRRLGGG